MSASREPRSVGPDPEAQQVWEDAQIAFRDRDYERAAELMQSLIAQWGEGGGGIDPAPLRLQLGITLLRLKRTEEGVAELRRSVQLDPYSGRARYKLGIGLARLGLNEEALQSLRQAVRLAPDVAEHQWRLAEELRRQGHRLEAFEAVHWCLELEPDHAAAKETLKALKKEGWVGWGVGQARTFLQGRLWQRRAPSAPTPPPSSEDSLSG